MKTLDEFLNEQMQDPEFKKEYENIQPELDEILQCEEPKKNPPSLRVLSSMQAHSTSLHLFPIYLSVYLLAIL